MGSLSPARVSRPNATSGPKTDDAAGAYDVAAALAAANVYTDAAVHTLTNLAPGTLDTFVEIATQLTADEGVVSALTSVVAGKANLTGGNTFAGTQTFGGAITANAGITSNGTSTFNSGLVVTGGTASLTAMTATTGTFSADVTITNASGLKFTNAAGTTTRTLKTSGGSWDTLDTSDFSFIVANKYGKPGNQSIGMSFGANDQIVLTSGTGGYSFATNAPFAVAGNATVGGTLTGTTASFVGSTSAGIKLKQGAQLNTGSYECGLVMENNGSTDAYLIGYSSGGDLTFNFRSGGGVYTEVFRCKSSTKRVLFGTAIDNGTDLAQFKGSQAFIVTSSTTDRTAARWVPSLSNTTDATRLGRLVGYVGSFNGDVQFIQIDTNGTTATITLPATSTLAAGIVTAVAPAVLDNSTRAPTTQWVNSLRTGFTGISYASRLPRIRAKLAGLRLGTTADAKILSLGNSLTMGALSGDANYPNKGAMLTRFVQLADGRGYPAATGLAIPPKNDGTTLDLRWDNTTAAGWALNGFGVAGQAAYQSTGSGTLRFTPSDGYSYDRVDIYYVRYGGGGTMTGTFAAGGTATWSDDGSSAIGVATVSATSASTSHRIDITCAGTAWVVGVEFWSSTTKRIRGGIAGVAGSVSGQHSGSIGSSPWATLGVVTAYQPDLTILELGFNDIGAAVSASTFSANMQAIITTAIAFGDVVLWIPPFPSSGSGVTGISAYLPTYYALAEANGCVVLDDYNRQGAYQSALMGDGLHHNNLGYFDLARSLAAMLEI